MITAKKRNDRLVVMAKEFIINNVGMPSRHQ